jgi:hypothetical protein
LGDPSGRGLALSYLKNMKRLGKDPVNRMLGKQDAASIMGTTSDLRKLPNKEVGEILKKQFNMDAATIGGLDRWERIGVLRELSNQACMSGTANVRLPVARACVSVQRICMPCPACMYAPVSTSARHCSARMHAGAGAEVRAQRQGVDGRDAEEAVCGCSHCAA